MCAKIKDMNDIVGRTYGKMTVIRYAPEKSFKRKGVLIHVYECECSCHNHTRWFARRGNITSGNVKSCGCARYGDTVDRMVAEHWKFGRLTVMDYAPPYDVRGAKISAVYCDCDCGTKHYRVRVNGLLNHNTHSCGCLMVERNRDTKKTHGKSYDPLYRILNGMVERCYNPKNNRYSSYGGRGIRVCKEWYNPKLQFAKKRRRGNPGFVAFYEWATANGYKPGLSIDRINVNGPYAPWNCRFVTQKDQMNNVRKNRYISDGEEILTWAQFCDKYHLPPGYVQSRRFHNWSYSAIVYAAKHQDINIHKEPVHGKIIYHDSEGFEHLIPKIPQPKKDRAT